MKKKILSKIVVQQAVSGFVLNPPAMRPIFGEINSYQEFYVTLVSDQPEYALRKDFKFITLVHLPNFKIHDFVCK